MKELKEILLFFVDGFIVVAIVFVILQNSEIIYSDSEKTIIYLIALAVLRVERMFVHIRKLSSKEVEQ